MAGIELAKSEVFKLAVFELNDSNKDEFPGYETPGWYFWNLSYKEVIGPFENKEKGEFVLEEYLDYYNDKDYEL